MALTDNLVAYWKMDSGSLADSTASSYGLTNSGATSVTGKINEGFSFNGTSDYMYAANNSDFNSKTFTISFWYKTTATGLVRPISKEWNGDSRKYGLLFNGYWNGSTTVTSNKSICIMIGTATGWQANTYMTTTNSNDGNFHHCAVTYNNGVLKMYHDGVQGYSATLANNMPASNTAPLYLGAGWSATRYAYFPGTLDEVAFYTREISSAEVSEIYNAGVGNQYPFSGGGGPTNNFMPFFLAHHG